MAQRIDPDDLPFDVPKFDEDEFVRKELISFKTTVVLFVFTLLVAAVTYVVWRMTGLTFLPLLALAMLGMFALKPIFGAFGMRIGHWKRKEWIGTTILYFFFWMGFTLLAFNPPFTDNAPPDILVGVSPPVQGAGAPIEFAALIRDNRGLDEQSVVFCLRPHTSGGGLPPWEAVTTAEREACRINWASGPGGSYRYTWTDTANATGTWAWYVSAHDDDGRNATKSGTVTIGRPFSVFTPAPVDAPAFDELTDRLVVTVSDQLHLLSVNYTIGTGPSYPMMFDKDQNQWFTTPEFPGWQHGANRVSITAYEQPKRLDTIVLAGRPVVAANSTFDVRVESNLPAATKAAPAYAIVLENPREATPGLGYLAGLAAIGASAVAHRKGRSE